MTYVDSAVLNLVERLCRRFQVWTGRTNVWLAFQLTNLSIIVYFIWVVGLYWLSGSVALRVFVAWFGAGVFFMAVIVAAGNHGFNDATGQIGFAGITSPGNAPSAITVGAVDAHGTQTLRDDAVAPYSSRGPTWYDGFAKPDVVVSGHRLAGLTGDGSYLSTNYRRSVVSMPGAGHKYLTLSGTSMLSDWTSLRLIPM